MRFTLLTLALLMGCASFSYIDLRPDDPIELGDTLVQGTSEIQYEVKGLDRVFYEATSIIACDNTHPDVPARCVEGGVCMAVMRSNLASAGGDRGSICMNDVYVNQQFRVIKRANLPEIRFE